MRVIESCAKCLWDRQCNLTDNKEYLTEIRNIIDNRKEDDPAPYLVSLFNRTYEKYFGKPASYKDVKKKYNDLVLSMEDKLRKKIETSSDPLLTSLIYAQVGNYIDFGAMNTVIEEEFLSLFDKAGLSERDMNVYSSFLRQCKNADHFLLLADNCGEIVLDKLFLEQLKKRFPKLEIKVMVRGSEVLNDATEEDACYVHINDIAEIVSNGTCVAGTVYSLICNEAKDAIDFADIILSKGQGNYESLYGHGKHVFYSFLCKCELFTDRFNVPRLTGVFIEENV